MEPELVNGNLGELLEEANLVRVQVARLAVDDAK
jgi:hypothetical protein